MKDRSTYSGVLLAEDGLPSLQELSEMLRGAGYVVHPVSNGREALHAALANPPELILLDINLQELDGYEVCERLKAQDRVADIPVIFISSKSEQLDKLKAFSVGGVDYITKPFHFKEVVARVSTHVKLHRLQTEMRRHNAHLQEIVTEQLAEILNGDRATICALSKLAEYRDEATGNHILRVQHFCKALAIRLADQGAFCDVIDDDFVDHLYHASPMHDIGKVAVPDAILLKPGKLTDEEFETIKLHPVLGADALSKVYAQYPNFLVKMGMELARSHHERWDGTGYPDALSQEAIPLSGRITMLADQYDALRTARPYKPILDPDTTFAIITQGDGRTMPHHFDPRILAAFTTLQDEFERIHSEFQG